jgi:hypothetical protein
LRDVTDLERPVTSPNVSASSSRRIMAAIGVLVLLFILRLVRRT